MPTKHGLSFGHSWRAIAAKLNLVTKRGSLPG